MSDIVVTQAGAAKEANLPLTDAVERVDGSYRFAIHRRIAGTVHAAVVRSIAPHGRMKRIDATAACDTAGVIGVVTGVEAYELLGSRIYHGEQRADQPVLAFDVVRYVGEPIAIVVAETRAIADAAAKLVDVDFDELPYVTNEVVARAPDAPQVHEEWPENDCGSATLVHGGDVDVALAASAHVHTATYTSPTANHAPLEPHVATGVWLDEQHLEIWSGTQAAWQVKRRLATMFDLPEQNVRVRVDNLGGGFGGKLDMKTEGMVALASWFVRRPVRLELRRDEMFVTSAKHAATVKVSTGCDAYGKLLARRVDVTYNAGAYAVSTPRAIITGLVRAPGPYLIPNVYVQVRGIYTNTVPTGPFRGAMTGQICFAGESAIDELATMAGIDSVEFRRRNVIRPGEEYATGEAMSDVKFSEIVEDLAAGVGWHGPLAPCPPGIARGRGVGLVIKSTRTPSRSEASVMVDACGSIEVWCSAAEMGQGAHRALSMMAARRLDVASDRVKMALVDTHYGGFDAPTSSARTTLMTGLAVERAADDVRDQLSEMARAHWGLPASNVTHCDGVVGVIGGSDELTYAELVQLSGRRELIGIGLMDTPDGYGDLDPDTGQGMHTVSWHQGGVAVEVEVDTETGRVRVVGAHSNSYAGRIIDPMGVKKQLEGGLIFGIGQALMEEVIFEDGELTNSNLADYQLPSILDAPARMSSTGIPSDDAHGHPHGLGENAVPPVAPAIANAIFAATGARIRELPLTAERVLRAISAARGKQKQ